MNVFTARQDEYRRRDEKENTARGAEDIKSGMKLVAGPCGQSLGIYHT